MSVHRSGFPSGSASSLRCGGYRRFIRPTATPVAVSGAMRRTGFPSGSASSLRCGGYRRFIRPTATPVAVSGALRRTGFTLIEMLVVIAIIGVLLGLLFPALGLLRKSQRKAATLKLMNEVSLAISQYLADYPLLGDTEANFENDPWRFLYRDPMTFSQKSYLTLTTKNLAKGVPPGPFTEAVERDGTVILDAFTATAHTNHLVFDVVNLANGTRQYTDSVRMTSTAGTPAKTSDDLILELKMSTMRWEPVTP